MGMAGSAPCTGPRLGGPCLALGTPRAPKAPPAGSSPLPLCTGTACGEPSLGQNIFKFHTRESGFMVVLLYIS